MKKTAEEIKRLARDFVSRKSDRWLMCSTRELEIEYYEWILDRILPDAYESYVYAKMDADEGRDIYEYHMTHQPIPNDGFEQFMQPSAQAWALAGYRAAVKAQFLQIDDDDLGSIKVQQGVDITTKANVYFEKIWSAMRPMIEAVCKTWSAYQTAKQMINVASLMTDEDYMGVMRERQRNEDALELGWTGENIITPQKFVAKYRPTCTEEGKICIEGWRASTLYVKKALKSYIEQHRGEIIDAIKEDEGRIINYSEEVK